MNEERIYMIGLLVGTKYKLIEKRLLKYSIDQLVSDENYYTTDCIDGK